MNSFFRTASRRTLASAIAASLVLAAGCTAIAVAATSGGPVPPRRSLAVAIHRALGAPTVQGITARISFTDSLISSSELQGSDPLLNGGQGRLWLDPAGHRLRIEVQGASGDAQLVVDGASFWIYDPAGNQVFKGSLPGSGSGQGQSKGEAVPSVAKISQTLARLASRLGISGAVPTDLAGRPAYSVTVSPRGGGGLLGSVQLAWDAMRGIPLRFAVFAKGSSSPVLELAVTHISYGRVSAADFAAAPPQGAKVDRLPSFTGRSGASSGSAHKPRVGLAAVSARAPFKVDAPASLAGLPRGDVRLLGSGAASTVLVGYGQGLGGLLVIERAATAKRAPSTNATTGDGHSGLSIPTVSIDGVDASELQTALGTALQFTRAGVGFVVLGSVPAKVAESAARGL